MLNFRISSSLGKVSEACWEAEQKQYIVEPPDPTKYMGGPPDPTTYMGEPLDPTKYCLTCLKSRGILGLASSHTLVYRVPDVWSR